MHEHEFFLNYNFINVFFLENISFSGNHGEVLHALWVSAIIQKHQKTEE